jgi:hypothetical protein
VLHISFLLFFIFVHQLQDLLFTAEGLRELAEVVLACEEPVEYLFGLSFEERVREDFLF